MAFELYLGLGAGRSFEKLRRAVADRYGDAPAKRSVTEWSRKFDWRRRVEEAEFEVGERIHEEGIAIRSGEALSEIEALRRIEDAASRTSLEKLQGMVRWQQARDNGEPLVDGEGNELPAPFAIKSVRDIGALLDIAVAAAERCDVLEGRPRPGDDGLATEPAPNPAELLVSFRECPNSST